jgi:3-oxoacyl-(acyl-carrier-protein) synthase
MGIVSSIGNNTQEVLASLHEAKSGISRAEKYAELGFRSQVQGAPTIDPATVVDRRAMRFLGQGAGFTAMTCGRRSSLFGRRRIEFAASDYTPCCQH